MFSYDDFKKLDMRIGTIISAERVPDTDKLLKLAVDLGEGEPRQIVAGIAEYAAPEDLVGKQCPFVANLEPRMIRGLESRGMLLAVGVFSENEGEQAHEKAIPALMLLHPAHPVPPGSTLR